MSTRPNAAAEVPFWERLRPMLAYPLHSEALLTITLLAFLRLLGYLPGVGIILNIVIAAATLKYAAEVLSSTANGIMEAPSGYNTPDSVGWVVLKVQVLLWVIGILLVIGAMAAGAPALAWVLGFAIALGAPAALMSAAIDQDTLGALNPSMWMATLSRIGWPYIGAALLCLILMISEGNAQQMMLPFLPGPLAVVGHYFIANYATVVTFHLLGYLVYQYRDALGYEIKQNAPTSLPRPKDRDQAVLDESESFAANGDTDNAARVLREYINERGATDAVHLRYRKLLTLHADTAALNKHAQQYLNVMIAQEKWAQALDFWSECRGVDPALWPSDPDQVRELVDKARELGKPELSLKFANGFSRAYPRHSAVGAIHLRVAQALNERLGKPAEARKLLEATREAYPKSKALPEIEAYLMRI
jgi:hypothetical protein